MKKVQPEEGESADIVSENIERLKELFPDAFSEGGQGEQRIDFDVLRQLLGDAGVLDEGESPRRHRRQFSLSHATQADSAC